MSDKIICNRTFAKASHATFTIPPIAEFVHKYVGLGQGWADPFSGNNSPASLRNDHDPSVAAAEYHMEAEQFVKHIVPGLVGAIFDPPYSYRQVSEHYKHRGKKATALDTSYNFYARVMTPLAKKIYQGGCALSFGWNSNGFGKKRGFEIIEVLIVAHGLHHNDTICVAERKVIP